MPAAFESVFEFLFKYRPLVFSRGEFALGASPSIIALVALALTAAIALTLTYARVRAESTRRDRILLATSRGALLATMPVVEPPSATAGASPRWVSRAKTC
jgi:hypothetical protein